MRLAYLGFVAFAACSFDGSGVDPGSSSGEVDAGLLDPDGGCVERCDGSDLVSCVAGQPDRATCPLGCGDQGGTPHCLSIAMSNGAQGTYLNGVTGDVDLSASVYSINTDSGAISNVTDSDNPIPIRPGGNGIDSGSGTYFTNLSGTVSLLAVDSFKIDSGTTVVAYGERALIVLARNNIVINGFFDFSAGCVLGAEGFTARCGGPGAGNGGDAEAGQGCAPGGAGYSSDIPGSSGNETGGAGGGLGGAGADGGTGGEPSLNPGGLASSLAACPGPTLVPLVGGSGGGGNPGTLLGGDGGDGGGGGGAVQLSAFVSISIGPNGVIYAAGGGGGGTAADDQGGGGGGSGGGILLESPSVTVDGSAILAANGGGGGGGRTPDPDAQGDFGTMSTQPATGGRGDGSGNQDGRGGDGGARNDAATKGNGNLDGTGGGGGGVGIIRINAMSNIASNGAVISPAHSFGTIGLQ